jgi:NADH pyrophosphatase NudC (nudix superfamily)
MTQEEKQLLLVDLCSRLSYRPKGVELSHLYDPENISIKGYDRGFVETLNDEIPIEKVRLYLRPMSSMTEKEAEEYNDLVNELSEYDCQPEQSASKIIDWLNEYHFDYRGLIPMGLALEAPEGMYKKD